MEHSHIKNTKQIPLVHAYIHTHVYIYIHMYVSYLWYYMVLCDIIWCSFHNVTLNLRASRLNDPTRGLNHRVAAAGSKAGRRVVGAMFGEFFEATGPGDDWSWAKSPAADLGALYSCIAQYMVRGRTFCSSLSGKISKQSKKIKVSNCFYHWTHGFFVHVSSFSVRCILR